MEPGELLPEPHSRMLRCSLLYSSSAGTMPARVHECSSQQWCSEGWAFLPSPVLTFFCSVLWGVSWARGVWYRCPLCTNCCILQKEAFPNEAYFLIYLLECCCLDQLRRALPCDWKHWGIVISFSMLKMKTVFCVQLCGELFYILLTQYVRYASWLMAFVLLCWVMNA